MREDAAERRGGDVPRAKLCFLICEMGMGTACPQRNEKPCSMKVLAASTLEAASVHTQPLLPGSGEGSLALVGWKPQRWRPGSERLSRHWAGRARWPGRTAAVRICRSRGGTRPHAVARRGRAEAQACGSWVRSPEPGSLPIGARRSVRGKASPRGPRTAHSAASGSPHGGSGCRWRRGRSLAPG